MGYQYRVTLQGIPLPTVGTILVGTGSKPIGGKVIAVNGNEVTLEVLRPNEMLTNFVLNDDIDLQTMPLKVNPSVSENFDLIQQPDGSQKFVLKPGKRLQSTVTVPGRSLSKSSLSRFKLGPLDSRISFGISVVFDGLDCAWVALFACPVVTTQYSIKPNTNPDCNRHRKRSQTSVIANFTLVEHS